MSKPISHAAALAALKFAQEDVDPTSLRDAEDHILDKSVVLVLKYLGRYSPIMTERGDTESEVRYVLSSAFFDGWAPEEGLSASELSWATRINKTTVQETLTGMAAQGVRNDFLLESVDAPDGKRWKLIPVPRAPLTKEEQDKDMVGYF